MSIRDEKGRHCPIIWKSRCLKRIVHSTIETEALALIEGAEGGMLVSEWWKEIWKTEIGQSDKYEIESGYCVYKRIVGREVYKGDQLGEYAGSSSYFYESRC